VSLTVTRSPATLLIATRNRADPPSRRASDAEFAGGLGLVGMRERVSAFGGTLSYGREEGDVFKLTVTLPLATAQS